MANILNEKINNIHDIKKLSFDELGELATELRDLIIKSISENGGHLASSLGVVELTIALLYSFDFDEDKIIWDVGHQSYAYKILTDRKDKFSNIRQYGGISGFPKRKESRYDFFDTGHSSTSISAGLGMCVARDLENKNYNVISVIGDGSLTGGMAFEALNNVSNLKSKYIIILNDNEMSISKSSGGLNKALLGIRSSKKYTKVKKSLKKVLEKSNMGLFIKNILVTIVNMFKQLVNKEGMFFENLDIDYVGPIDGHNIKQMCEIFDIAKNNLEPIVIHIKTTKGKGYLPAENNPTFFHGVSAFDINTGELKNKNDKKTYTKVFSEELLCQAEKNKKIISITAAMADGTGLTEFSKKYPDRFFDVGICEQHAVTFASGISTQGLIPVVCIYSSFLQRAFDQIIHDICLQNQHVILAIDRAGLVGADGDTHQGIFDISFLRIIPNMTILAPKNDIELKQMIDFAINKMNSPVAIRYPRGIAYIELSDFDKPVEYGKAEELYNDGSDLVIFALGSMVSTAIHIREKLENKNIKTSVINLRFAKPIDYDMIDKYINYKQIVVMEEGVGIGGIGEEIEEYIYKKNKNTKVILINIKDTFVEHGSVSQLKKVLKIDSDSIIDKILNER